MTASAAILETPVLRAADGSPPLGAGGLFFRDDQGEVFEYRSPNVKIIVLELDNGHWLAKPLGLGIDEDQYETRDEALESACDHMMRLARLYMAAGEGEGVHWTEDFGNGVIRWADGLRPKQALIQADSVASATECDHPITEQAIIAKISGGIGSYLAAKRHVEMCGRAGLQLLFTDTLCEDQDAYRFLIAGAAVLLGVSLPPGLIPAIEDFPAWEDREPYKAFVVALAARARDAMPGFNWISDGRDVWDIYEAERFLGNSRIDPCSKILKRQLADRWLSEHCEPGNTRIIVGIDYEEAERFVGSPKSAGIRAIWESRGWTALAPLCDAPLLPWKDRVQAVERAGLWLPRLNAMGFAHNNCGGFCCKAGHGHWKLMLQVFPERYAYAERREKEIRAILGDVAMLTDRRGGAKKPLTLEVLRTRDLTAEESADMGGCNCYLPMAGTDGQVIANQANLPDGGLNPQKDADTIPDPIVRALHEANRARRIFPSGHAFSMTNPIINGKMVTMGTCSCGESFSYSYGSYERMDAAIEAHWQRFDHLPEKVNGRGEVFTGNNADSPKSADIKPKRSRAKGKSATEQKAASDTAALPSEAGGVAIASEPAPAVPSLSAGAGEIQHAPIGAPADDDPFWNDPFVKQLQALAWRDGDAVPATYEGFLRSKVRNIDPCGFDVDPAELNAALKPFQRDIVTWLLKQGKAALFAGTGLGKTLQQLTWADKVVARLSGPVLVLSPLAVAQQTVAEAEKFGIPSVAYAPSQQTAATSIVVTNYERLQHFDPSRFAGVVLDESSILKAFDGKTRNALTDAFGKTPFRLCCTATPAPNDYTELGNHSEFLGILQHKEMLATWFVHDGSSRATNVENYGQRQGSDWRLKGHAHDDFWRWLATWSIMVRHPRDLGYEDAGYDLPPLHRHQVTIGTGAVEGLLGDVKVARTLTERLQARRNTIAPRVAAAAEIVNSSPGRQWLVWCNLNDESSSLTAAIPGAIEVRGSDDPDVKAERLLGFARGEVRVLVSKPSIAGWGMNFQSCADMVFVGLNDSFEQLYQAVRRCWRFGQTREVNVHLIAADVEGEVVANLTAKEEQADYMAEAMVGHMRGLTVSNLRSRRTISAHETVMELPEWLKCA